MSILKSSITAIVILIVFALLWATGLYLMILSKKAHVKYDNEKVFFHAPTDASLQKKIKNKELPTRITDEIYSLGFWMYVESWDNKKNQHIISKGVGLCHQPSIYLSKDDNKLLIKLTKNSLHDTDVCLHEDIEIPDIPIKRWVHFYMNVERSVVNIYINSFLVTSHILKVPIKQNDVIPYIEFICSLSNKVKVEKFEDTGHYITIEQPEKTNKLIIKWLNDIQIDM